MGDAKHGGEGRFRSLCKARWLQTAQAASDLSVEFEGLPQFISNWR